MGTIDWIYRPKMRKTASFGTRKFPLWTLFLVLAVCVVLMGLCLRMVLRMEPALRATVERLELAEKNLQVLEHRLQSSPAGRAHRE